MGSLLVSDNTVLAKVVTIEVPVAAGVGDIAVAGLSEVRSDAWMIGLHLPPEPGDWKNRRPAAGYRRTALRTRRSPDLRNPDDTAIHCVPQRQKAVTIDRY